MSYDPRWNKFTQIFDGDTRVVVDDSGSNASVEVNGAQIAEFVAGGMSLITGTTINEFSIDGTLVGDSDDAVPTEKAVKTYVDTQIGESANWIWEGDSYVKVVDDTTAVGYVEIVTDGVQVAYFDPSSATQRIGKASGAGRVSVTDTEVTASVGASELLDLTATTQRMGISTDSYLQVAQSSDTITGVVGTTTVMSLAPTIQTIGDASDFITVNQGSNNVSVTIGSTVVTSLSQNSQTFGVSDDTKLVLNQTADTADLYAGSVQVIATTTTSQVFGVAGDTRLALDQTADTFSLNAGASTVISGGLTSLTLGVGGDTSIALNQSTDQISITAGGQSQILVETTGTTIYDDLTVTGDLFVDGTTWVVHNQEVTTSDNVIVINNGEPGAGVTSGTAGLEIDRGTLTNYLFIFDEATDTFRVGEVGSTQAVATREDTPTTMLVPWWNDTDKRFDTAGSSSVTINTTTDVITFTAASSAVATFESDGLTLAAGTNINEFSTDGTLLGDSDDAVPTEKAVKTYVDAQISSSESKVSEGNSYLQVHDDGTTTSYVEVVIDGVQVQYWDSEATSVRMGKLTGAGSVTATDTSVVASVSSVDGLTLTVDTFRLGVLNDTNFELYDSGATQTATLEVGGTSVMFASASANQARFGTTTDNIDINYSTHITTFGANNVDVLSLAETTQTLGVSGDSSIVLSQSANTVVIDAGTVEVFNASTTIVTVGIDSDTLITINSTSDTVVVTANSTGVATFAENGLTLETGANVDEFSIDGTLVGDSDTAVPTEKAVKTYVDAEIASLRNELDLNNVKHVSSDTTAQTGDILLVNTAAGNVNIDLQEVSDGKVVVKKITSDLNTVIISTTPGTIDGEASVTLDTAYQSYHFISDGDDYFIL